MMKLKHKGTMLLNTKNLILKKTELIDLERVYKYMLHDKESCRICKWKYYEKLEDLKNDKDIITYEITDYIWLIFIRNNNIPIGTISVHSLDEKNLNCAIGYQIHPKYQNNGYCTEALNSVVKFLINEVGFERIEGCCLENNIASRSVLEKANFKLEGIKRNARYSDNQLHNLYVYSFIRSDL